MNIVRVLCFLLIINSSFVFSQNKIQGKVIDVNTEEGIKNVEIYLSKAVELWQDELGNYTISNLKKGVYEIAFYCQGHALDKFDTIRRRTKRSGYKF